MVVMNAEVVGRPSSQVEDEMGRQGHAVVNEQSNPAATGNEMPAAFAKRRRWGSVGGVFMPVCEVMWGGAFLLRFPSIVGNAGIRMPVLALVFSATATFCTAFSAACLGGTNSHDDVAPTFVAVSRVLGEAIGTGIGLLHFLGVTALAAVASSGAAQGLLMFNPDFYGLGGVLFFAPLVAVAAIFTSYRGIEFATIAGVGVFAASFVLSILPHFVGLLTASPESVPAASGQMGVGFSTARLAENWIPEQTKGVSFGHVMDAVFPCFLGVLTGSPRTSILRQPVRSVFRGTSAAVVASCCLYVSAVVLWGSLADRRFLRGERNSNPIEQILWDPFPGTVGAGILIACVGQTIQCAAVAPWLLQSLAKASTYSILQPLAPLSVDGEPLPALVAFGVTMLLLVFVLRIVAVGALLTTLFLLPYFVVNCACAVHTYRRSTLEDEHAIAAESSWAHMCTGVTGAVACATTMFVMSWLWALCLGLIAMGLCSCLHLSNMTRSEPTLCEESRRRMSELRKTYRPEGDSLRRKSRPECTK